MDVPILDLLRRLDVFMVTRSASGAVSFEMLASGGKKVAGGVHGQKEITSFFVELLERWSELRAAVGWPSEWGDAAHLGAQLAQIQMILDKAKAPTVPVEGLPGRAAIVAQRVEALAHAWAAVQAVDPKHGKSRVPTAQNDPSLVKRHDAAHALMDAAGLPKGTLPERIAALLDRERGIACATHLACARAVDTVAARFAKLGMEDAEAAAREAAVAVRMADGVDACPPVLVSHVNVDDKVAQDCIDRFRKTHVSKKEAERALGLKPGEQLLELAPGEREKLERGEFARGRAVDPVNCDPHILPKLHVSLSDMHSLRDLGRADVEVPFDCSWTPETSVLCISGTSRQVAVVTGVRRESFVCFVRIRATTIEGCDEKPVATGGVVPLAGPIWWKVDRRRVSRNAEMTPSPTTLAAEFVAEHLRDWIPPHGPVYVGETRTTATGALAHALARLIDAQRDVGRCEGRAGSETLANRRGGL